MTLVPTYLSHSYRHADLELNERFFRYFWDQGFAFTVDPKSEVPVLTQLELMMQRSAAFVAVAPFRSGVDYYNTSPFIVYEYGLAVQARRPALVFAEENVAGSVFHPSHIIPFHRETIADLFDQEDVTSKVAELRERSMPDAAITRRPLRSVGLLLPPSDAYRTVMPIVEDVLDRSGYAISVVDRERKDFWRLLLDLQEHDFVVTDIEWAGRDWLYPLLYGRFVPTVKLRHLPDVRGAEQPLPDMLRNRALRTATTESEIAIDWSTGGDLREKLLDHVNELQHPRKQFHSIDEGQRYFRSLGRAESGPVFLSNVGDDNDLARSVTRTLQLYNIEVFHYVFQNSLTQGAEYSQPLRDKIAASSLFIPLLSRKYWASPWCVEEYELADHLRRSGRLDIAPFLIDDPREGGMRDIPLHAERLVELDADKRSATIATKIDQSLREKKTVTHRARATLAAERDRIDVAIVTVLPEEYAAVRRKLKNPVTVLGDTSHPNKYAWDVGDVRAAHQRGTYRVVVGLTGGAGTSNGLLAVLDTARAFRPSWVLLVGIAGGLQELRVGDVVVSDVIYGYEYGKVHKGRFEPRHGWTHHGADAMITAAKATEARSPEWYREVSDRYPDGHTPKVVVGPVASGNKVVDDVDAGAFAPVLDSWPKLVAIEMEGLGAAEAARSLREDGMPVNFTMVRGISDLPAEPKEQPADSPRGPSPQTQQRDDAKPVACAIAAEFAFYVLREAWPIPPLANDYPKK